MRRWLRTSTAAAAEVADRPELWLPGALAWTVSVGWIALVAGVIRPPGVAELTFFGARAATSGLWPWNLVLALAVLAALVGAAFGLASFAEAALARPPSSMAATRRGFVVSLACAVPVTIMLLAVGIALPGVAQAEFNAADAQPGPLLRTVLRLLPLLAAVLVAFVAGGAIHAGAVRSRERSAEGALRAAPRRLASGGPAVVVHALVLATVRIGFVVLAAVMLRVLWDPIGIRLEADGIASAALLLLVGFVAIWLCLVLAGGALHAWGSVTWTRLLAATDGEAAARPQQMERRPGP
jgi:hypothetical protein